jgi:magnesium-transporting ATPase (P-type)
VFAFALLRLLHEQNPVVVHTSWFLFLGSTALVVLFAVRSSDWFWSRPWPSGVILMAVGAAFVVTIALVNIPLTQSLLGFTQLSWGTQLAIEAYGLLYVAVASALVHGLARVQPEPEARSHRRRARPAMPPVS